MAEGDPRAPAPAGEAETAAAKGADWAARLVRHRQHLLFAAGLLMLAAFVALVLGLRTQSWRPVYAGLSEKDAARVVEALQKARIPYRLEGGAVLVPADRVYAVRIRLAGEGVAPKGGVGFELFDRNDELGLSEFTRRVNLQRALQGELARTIEVIPQVAAARVHVVLPEDSPFAGRERKASASVMLRLTGELPRRSVAAIQNLVAAAVPDLDPSRVVVVDANGRQLSSNTERDGVQTDSIEEYQAQLERRLEDKLTTLLERIVGPGQAVARVHVELDRAYLEEHATSFNPDEQVARSERTLDESRTSTGEAPPVGVPGIASNTPGANPQVQQAARPQDRASRRERVVRYEISSVERRRIVPAGAVRRITAAVAVGGKTGKDGGFTPLPAAELRRIEALVKRAIGYDEERGDLVTVESMPLLDVRSARDAAALEAAEKRAFYLKLARYFTAALVALLVVWFGVRPLAQRVSRGEAEGRAGGAPEPLPAPETPQAIEPPASESMMQIELARRAIEADPERARRVLAEWVSS